MITFYDCALLSLDVYTDGSELDVAEARERGWRRADFTSDPESGFAGALYTRSRGPAVLACRGTEAGDPRDWRAVSDIGAGRVPEAQVEAASQFLASHRARPGRSEGMFLTGHSLGGVLAQLLALESESRAVVFNAPSIRAIVDDPPSRFDRLIHNFHARGDVLNRPGGFVRRRMGEPVGRVTEVEVEATGFFILPTGRPAGLLRSHSMRRMARALRHPVSSARALCGP